MGGVMSLTGEPDGLPQKVGVPVADLFAGLYGCIGILAALRHRDATGEGSKGQQIDIGMLDTHVAWLANQGMNYLATGENPARLGNQHPNIVPYQVFPTADGHIVLSIGNDPTFKRFCEAFALTHLLEDARFATNAARVENRQLVTDTLTPVMQQQQTDVVGGTAGGAEDRLRADQQAVGGVRRSARGRARRGARDGAWLGRDGEGDRQPGAPVGDAAGLSHSAADAGRAHRCGAARAAGAGRGGVGGVAGEGRDLTVDDTPRRPNPLRAGWRWWIGCRPKRSICRSRAARTAWRWG